MATIAPGTAVTLEQAERAKLRFPPPPAETLVVCVHEMALRAPRSRLTLVLSIQNDDVGWIGALDERMLAVGVPSALVGDARSKIKGYLLRGDRLFDVVAPGLLTETGVRTPLFDVYDGDRPWIVLGELTNGALLAAPRNSVGNVRWWTPVLDSSAVEFYDSSMSPISAMVELAHLWCLPASVPTVGRMINEAPQLISNRVKDYF